MSYQTYSHHVIIITCPYRHHIYKTYACHHVFFFYISHVISHTRTPLSDRALGYLHLHKCLMHLIVLSFSNTSLVMSYKSYFRTYAFTYTNNTYQIMSPQVKISLSFTLCHVIFYIFYQTFMTSSSCFQ